MTAKMSDDAAVMRPVDLSVEASRTRANLRPAVHGGQVQRLAREHGIDPATIVDFSASISPLGPPTRVLARLAEDVRDTRLLSAYPDSEARALREAVAADLGVGPDRIVIGAGTAALIHAIVSAPEIKEVKRMQPGTCLLPVPSFTEYQHALDVWGWRTVTLPLGRARIAGPPEPVDVDRAHTPIIPASLRRAAGPTTHDGTAASGRLASASTGEAAGAGRDSDPIATSDGFALDELRWCEHLEALRPDLCILTNPHNPSGTLTPPDVIDRTVAVAARTGTLVVVDEAFIDFCPHATSVALIRSHEHLIVLRSPTKFYGMAALRVGWAVCGGAWAERLTPRIPTWPVTTVAMHAAIEALADEEYAQSTRAATEAERRWLEARLRSIGLVVHPSTANFLLVRWPDAAGDADTCATALLREAHLAVRSCAGWPGFADRQHFRIAVRTRPDNERLIAALQRLLLRLSEQR